jgi:hypothetical protein
MNSESISQTELPFLAGVDDDGMPVFESLQVELLEDDVEHVRLLMSPLLARNLAAGDKLRVINPDTAEYELVQRSGNLCIRLFCKDHLSDLEESLTSTIERLGGSQDLQTERALVYSIHFSIGFQTIEGLLNKVCEDYPNTVWYYGNVYDPEDGKTPLEWWLEFDNQD